MWTWLQRLWHDEDVAARLVRSVAIGISIWMTTPKGRSEWDRILPAVLAVVGVGLPSAKKPQ